MKNHWIYLKYVVRHKWYCVKACWKIAPSWLCEVWFLGIFHDWSKFRFSEWTPYAEHFYGDGRSLDEAWLKHIHRNKHHWQYWILREDDGETKCLDMPDRYILEMVADWYAAGMVISKRPFVGPWYVENKDKIIMSERTRKQVETVIKNFDARSINRTRIWKSI